MRYNPAMDIPVKQNPASPVEVSTADPWTFAEEVLLGEQRYLVRWTVKGHYLAESAAVWIEDDTMRAEDVPADDTPQFTVTVKWDGCCDWRFSDDGYLHTCDPTHVAALCGAVVYVQTRGLQVLEARADDHRLGIGKWA